MKQLLKLFVIVTLVSVCFGMASCGGADDGRKEASMELAKGIRAALEKSSEGLSLNDSTVTPRDSVFSENLEKATNTLSGLQNSPFSSVDYVPLLGIVFSIGGPIILVIFIVWFSYRDKRNRYRLLEKAIENNMDSEQVLKLLESKKAVKADSQKSSVRQGLICLFAGWGCFIAYYVFHTSYILGVGGLIATLVGIGMLIAYFLERRDKKSQEETEGK